MRHLTLLLFLSCLPLFTFGMKPVSETSPVDYHIENTTIKDTLPTYKSTEETESVESENEFLSFLSSFAKFSAIVAAGGIVIFFIGLLINTTGLLASFGLFLWLITFPVSLLSVFISLLFPSDKIPKTKKQKKQLKQAGAILLSIVLSYVLISLSLT